MSEPDFLRDKFSFSKCDTFSKCNRRFFLRYVMRLREMVQPWLLFGRAVHEGQETDNLAKLRGERLSTDNVLDASVEALKGHARQESVSLGGAAVDAFAEEHGLQLEAFERSGQRAKINPVPGSVEGAFELDVKVGDPEYGLEPARVEGFTDVVSADEEEGRRRVVDYKTAARPATQKEAEEHGQLALEQFGAEAESGQIVTFVKQGKQKPNAKVTKPVATTPGRVERVLRFLADQIHGIRRAIKTGDFPKCAPTAFWCQHGKGCEFGYLCYPEKPTDTHEFIQVEKIRPVGTVAPAEWRMSEAAKKAAKEAASSES